MGEESCDESDGCMRDEWSVHRMRWAVVMMCDVGKKYVVGKSVAIFVLSLFITH